MRISDWSSDVCSSDLSDRAVDLDLGPQRGGPGLQVGKDAVGGRGIGEMRHAATSAIARVADIERTEAHRRRTAVVIVHLRHHALIPTGRITARAARFAFGHGRSAAEPRGGKEGVSTCRFLWWP